MCCIFMCDRWKSCFYILQRIRLNASRNVNIMGFFLVIYMQTSPYPSQKWLNWDFDKKRCAIFWNLWKKKISRYFAVFISWDMVDFILKMLKKVNQNDKKKCCPKGYAMFWHLWKNKFPIYVIFRFREMLNFVLKFFENWPQYHNSKNHIIIRRETYFAPISIVTRSKYVSEDSMKMKKKSS